MSEGCPSFAYSAYWLLCYNQQELNLSYGEITADAALAVVEAVKNKDQLEKLDLNGT